MEKKVTDNRGREAVVALPVWEDSNVEPEIISDMRFHSPFIYTKGFSFHSFSDLGDCIISTFAPNMVCRVHTFRTHVGKNEEDVNMITKGMFGLITRNENKRMTWLQQRAKAFRNAEQAQQQHTTIRELIENRGGVYDEEFDEPRVIAKVPGLNVYLEFVGFLGRVVIDYENNEKIWNGEHGVYATMKYMSLWLTSSFSKNERRRYQSFPSDWQPLDEWRQGYNSELEPWKPKRMGFGFQNYDYVRREKLLSEAGKNGNTI